LKVLTAENVSVIAFYFFCYSKTLACYYLLLNVRFQFGKKMKAFVPVEDVGNRLTGDLSEYINAKRS